PYSYAGAPASSADSLEGNVRVWFAQEGPHAASLGAATSVATIAEHALDAFGDLGFPAPLDDAADVGCASNGGDDRLDIYLFDFASSADGTIVLEACQGSVCRGFALIEN